ncbi:unnamed protein product [Durusdinium trenchii]|uniref:Uncharacterized protein n=1 Tax=Durusdinium trenchii TaxID=1381693 RepID=A0ABP0Q3C1_9DINO
MVGSEHNGNAKPPTMSWRQYFEQAIGKKIENAPVNFNAHEMSFEEALILLSTHIGLLRKDLEKTKKLVAHQKERVAKSKVVSKRAEDRRKRKVEKTFDSIHNEEKQEEERPGAGKKRYWGRKTKDGGVWTKPLPKARVVPTIEDKLSVLRFYKDMKESKIKAKEEASAPRPAKATKRERRELREKRQAAKQQLKTNLQKLCQERFPNLLKGAQICKWAQIAKRESWEELPESIRCRTTSVPNAWRMKLGIPLRGRKEGGDIPLPLQRELDLLMMEAACGASLVSERKDIVTIESLVHGLNQKTVESLEETIGSLVSDWNHALEETTSKVKAWNAELMSWFEQGQMSAEAVLAGFEPVPKLLQKPTSQWCRMWKRKWGWSTLTRSHEDGQSLGFDHPDMACSRVAFHSLFSDHQVDPRLVLNYDQLWRNAWSTSKFKVSYKHRLFAGATGEREAVEPRVSKKINQPKGARRSITVAGHKKSRYGLDISSRGAILCDAWTGTFRKSDGLELRRNQWYKMHNIHPPRVNPGGFEELDIKASGQVAASVQPWVDILKLTNDAWWSLSNKVHQSAWLICGYFDHTHFLECSSSQVAVESLEAAKQLLDPTRILEGSGLQPTPQFCTVFEWQLEDGNGKWQQLPYEIAHGVVRTLTKHAYDYLCTKRQLRQLLESDPNGKKSKTKKCQEECQKMQHVDHYLIFNRRTGQVATGEWVRKHVITGPDNKPRMKNEASTAKPWIMTLRIDLVESNVQVYLRPKDNESFRRVRCFALQEGREKAKLAHITSGYAHLIHEGVVQAEQVDPAPAPSAGSHKEPTHPAEMTVSAAGVDEESREVPEASECAFMVFRESCESKSVTKFAPAQFMLREAYLSLCEEKLVALPPVPGCGLYHHNSTHQWHAVYGHEQEFNRAPSWSASLRSERKALLLALESMWAWYCKTDAATEADRKHLDILSQKLQETSF